MKIKLSLLLVVIIFVAIVPIPLPQYDGMYNSISGLLWCRNERACTHEIGHKLDDEGRWVSHTEEFSLAVEAFLWIELAHNETPHPFVYKIMAHSGVFEWQGWFVDPQAELYASLFEWSGGVSENMPELLRPFYDWERAQELIEKVIR